MFRLEGQITAGRDDKRCDGFCPNMAQRTFFAIGPRNKMVNILVNIFNGEMP